MEQQQHIPSVYIENSYLKEEWGIEQYDEQNVLFNKHAFTKVYVIGRLHCHLLFEMY